MIRLKPKTEKPKKPAPASKAPAVIVIEDEKTLSDRQQRFCMEYVIDLNGTQAAIRAGYSQNGADVQAVRLLGNASVKTEIDRLKAVKAQKLGITQEKVLMELGKLGFSNMGDYMRVGIDGLPQLNFANLTRDHTAALQEVTVDTYWDESALVPADPNDEDSEPQYGREVKKVKFKLADKHSSLVSLGRHLNLFGDRDQDRAAIGDASIARTIVEVLLSRQLPAKPANAIEI